MQPRSWRCCRAIVDGAKHLRLTNTKNPHVDRKIVGDVMSPPRGEPPYPPPLVDLTPAFHHQRAAPQGPRRVHGLRDADPRLPPNARAIDAPDGIRPRHAQGLRRRVPRGHALALDLVSRCALTWASEASGGGAATWAAHPPPFTLCPGPSRRGPSGRSSPRRSPRSHCHQRCRARPRGGRPSCSDRCA